jgi:hypothetical protein
MMAIRAIVFIEHAKLTVKKKNNRQLHIFHLSFFVINWKQEENNSPSTITITPVHLLWCSLRVSEIIFIMYALLTLFSMQTTLYSCLVKLPLQFFTVIFSQNFSEKLYTSSVNLRFVSNERQLYGYVPLIISISRSSHHS